MIHLMLNVASVVQHHPTSSSVQTHIYWAKFKARTRSKDPNSNHEGWALGYDFDAGALLLQIPKKHRQLTLLSMTFAVE